MQGNYLAIYKLHGSGALPEGEDAELLAVSEPSTTVTLTTRPDDYCLHLDRRYAIANTLLERTFGTQGDSSAVFEAQLASVKEARRKHGPSGVFLVINSSGELGKPDFTHRRDLDDFVVCFDAFSTTALRDSIRTIINGALAAVSVSLENRYTRDVTFLGEVTYAVDPASHKPIYSFHPEGSFTATLSGTLDHQTLESIRKYARLLVEDEALEQVVRLLAHSHETKDRMLQSFIEAWAALEMFIERSFKRCYEREWRAAQPRGGVALFGSGSPGLGTNLLAPRANMRCVTESSEACAIMWLWSWSMVKMMRQQIARKIATIASVTWLSVHG